MDISAVFDQQASLCYKVGPAGAIDTVPKFERKEFPINSIFRQRLRPNSTIGWRRLDAKTCVNLILALALLGFSGLASAYTKMVDGANVYSPFLLLQPSCLPGQCTPLNHLYMYLGGWLAAGQTNDAIYRIECSQTGDQCFSSAIRVLDPSPEFTHLNDPTIVLMDGPSPFYIMYMTGVPLPYTGVETVIDSKGRSIPGGRNRIFYSTSFANDGVNWSRPQPLFPSATANPADDFSNDNALCWLPSVTKRGPEVFLWCNAELNGQILVFSLGTSGTAPKYLGTASPPIGYNNVNVTWRSETNLFEILGQSYGTSPRIDYLESADGLSWNLAFAGAANIDTSSGQVQIGTPAAHPHTASKLYFRQTTNSNSTDNKIYFSQWRAYQEPPPSTPPQTVPPPSGPNGKIIPIVVDLIMQ